MTVAVMLDNPKTGANVGSVIRSMACYGAELLITTGKRKRWKYGDTRATACGRHVPWIHAMGRMDSIPPCHVPVAVELTDEAVSLQEYEHPCNALYVFGAEDATLGREVLECCRDVVYIPCGCLNLSHAVTAVLHDRRMKG